MIENLKLIKLCVINDMFPFFTFFIILIGFYILFLLIFFKKNQRKLGAWPSSKAKYLRSFKPKCGAIFAKKILPWNPLGQHCKSTGRVKRPEVVAFSLEKKVIVGSYKRAVWKCHLFKKNPKKNRKLWI